MSASYNLFLIPALLGAQLLMNLILVKGDICPGQRGRVHKVMPVLVVGWALSSVTNWLSLAPLALVTFFLLRVQTGKTRNIGPMWAMYLANVSAAVVWGMYVSAWPLPQALASLVATVLLGGALGHLMLVQARSRLQAFHRLLPFAGVVAGITSVLVVLWSVSGMTEVQLEAARIYVVVALLTLIISLALWGAHILLTKTVNRWQILAALGGLVSYAGMQLQLFIV